MEGGDHITYLKNDQINREAWNACLKRHRPDLLYLQAEFLDIMVPGWQGLVIARPNSGEYQAIMPLPWRVKWGIQYLYQPYLAAQLGYVGNNNSPEELERFLAQIPKQIKYIDYCLNDQNHLAISWSGMYLRCNLVLPLDQPYPQLVKAYSENTRRNIRLATESNLLVHRTTDWKKGLEHYIEFAYTKPGRHEIAACTDLLEYYSSKNQVDCFYVKDTNGDLLSSCIFFIQQNRIYYLLPANSASARKKAASHLLVDAVVQAYSGKFMLLDFEGSDVESVARFYKGFGAIEQNYPALKMNRIPRLLRWMKK